MQRPSDPTARLLVLTPTGCDAQLVFGALAGQFDVFVCPRPEDLLPELTAGVGAVLIAEEAITPTLLRDLVVGVNRQEPWSDVPFLVLSGKPPARNLPDWATRDVLSQLEPLGNVTVLERPVRIRTLSGVVRVALESRKRQQQMRLLHENVQAMNRGKDEFLAMLGHELRNPLGAIRMALAVLPQVKADEARLSRYLDILDRQSLAMKRMLDDLLDVSRVSLGKVRLEVQHLDVGELVHRTVESLQGAAKALDHALTVDGPAEGLIVRGDPVRLEQVITNVVGNALKYTPRGGRVQVAFGRDGPDAVISVSDNGIGLEPEMVSKVFELFAQARIGLDRAQGGLGVGLALVDCLVKMHGGRVTAKSEGLGKGSEFRIHLPTADFVDESSGSVTSIAPEGAGLRVVVVDDHQDLRETLEEVLSAMGHDVSSVATGVDAMALAQSSTPDLMLVDIGLPGIDGYEVARRVRAACSGDLHLVAVTGYGMPEDRRRSLDAGFDDHLVKPIDTGQLEQLFARVATRFGRARRREAS